MTILVYDFQRLRVIKHFITENLIRKGVHGLVCVSLGVLDVKTFENHWLREIRMGHKLLTGCDISL